MRDALALLLELTAESVEMSLSVTCRIGRRTLTESTWCLQCRPGTVRLVLGRRSLSKGLHRLAPMTPKRLGLGMNASTHSDGHT